MFTPLLFFAKKMRPFIGENMGFSILERGHYGFVQEESYVGCCY